MHFQHLFTKISRLTRDIFTYLLAVYLVLFLLENLIPGFVSNNFDLNYLLYSLIVVGIFSSFSPEKESAVTANLPPTFFDYLLTVTLSLLGAFLIYLKIDLTLFLRLTISAISGLLIFLTSLLVITPDQASLSSFRPHLHHLRKTLNFWPVIASFFIVVAIAAAVHFHQQQITQPNPKIQVVISNCSYNDDIGPTLVKTLIKKGYLQTTLSAVPSRDCNGVTVYFSPADKDQADIVAKNLESLYPVIQKAPPITPILGKITIVLGNNYF